MLRKRTFLLACVVALTSIGAASPRANASGCCPCDWNNSGTPPSPQDIFDFLADFFAGNGDFNQSGATTPQDIFDFLACFFAGCPSPCYAGNPNPNAPGEKERALGSEGCGGNVPAYTDNVYLFSGECRHDATDMVVKGRGIDFAFHRRYRSQSEYDGPMGYNWDHSYNIFITQAGPGGADRQLHNGLARNDTYRLQPDGTWTRPEFFRVLRQNPDQTLTMSFSDGTRWNFRALIAPQAGGKISSIVDRNNNTISFAYDPFARLTGITDTLGRTYTLNYNLQNRLISLTDYTGRQCTYAIAHSGDLLSATSPAVTGTPNGNDFPAGKTTTYTYSSGQPHPNLDHNLLTITDPRGQIYLTNTYHPTAIPGSLDFDRVTRQVWGIGGGAGDILDYAYIPIRPPVAANGFAVMRAIVNDREGHIHEYFYDGRNRLVRRDDYTGLANPDLPTTDVANRPIGQLRPSDPPLFTTRWTYNTDSLVTRTDNPNANFDTRTYDPSADPLVRSNCLQRCHNPGPLGGDQAQICETFEYLPGMGGCCGAAFVTRHIDGRGNQTLHSYDGQGNRIQTIHRIPTIVENWEYNAFGQMTKHINPRDGIGAGCRRVDVMTYYAAGPQTGYMQTSVVDVPDAAACAGPHFSLTTTYEYDARGNLVRRTDPRGNTTEYIVNQLDQAVRELSPPVVGPARQEKLYYYDANNNHVRTDIENRDGNGVLQPNTHFSTITDYEALNRPSRVCSEDGAAALANTVLTCAAIPAGQMSQFTTTEFAYDTNRNLILQRAGEATNGNDPLNQLQTSFDERDLVFVITRAPGAPGQSSTRHDYDGNRNRIFAISPLESGPRTTNYAYDGYDRLIRTTDNAGNETETHFDANSNTTSIIIRGELLDLPGSAANVRLSETTYQYDAMDRRIRKDVAHFDTQTQVAIGDGQATSTTVFNDNSTMATEADDHGHTTTYAYDSANRRRTVTDPAGNSVTYSYDANSNTVTTLERDLSTLASPPQDFTTTYAYDSLNRLISSIDSAANTRTYSYDSRNNRALDIDPRGNKTAYAYDGLNRLVRTIHDMDADGPDGDGTDVVTEQSWDDSSRKVESRDDNANPTRYAYDSLDRLTRTDYADGTLQLDSYDQHDRRTQRTDPNGSVMTYAYDTLDRLVQITIVPGAGVAPAPPAGQGTTSETYQYDGLSRLIRAQDNDSLITRGGAAASGYDSLSDVLRETQQITNPAAPARTVTAAYDGVGNQVGLTYPGGRVVTRTFDPLERPLIVRDIGPVFTLATYNYYGPSRLERLDYGNGTRTDVQHDAIRRIANITHSSGGGAMILDDRTYAWDPNSNKSSVVHNNVGPPNVRSYAYDALNRLIVSDSSGVWPDASYTLDGLGNRINVIGTPDGGPYANDPPGTSVNQYAATPFDNRQYDANGNLTTTSGDALSADRLYIYDYRNRLVEFRDLNTAVTTTYKYDCLDRRIQKTVGATTTRYYFDGPEEIEEQSAGNVTVATYVYSKGDHTRIGMTRSGQRWYFHEDDQGSVVKVTNAAGTVVDHTEYSDFGKPFVPGGPQNGNLFSVYDSDRDPAPGGTAEEICDDFWFPVHTQITGLTFRGGYDYQPIVPPNDQFMLTVYFADPITGLPGPIFFQQFFSPGQVNRVPTGRVVCCAGIPNVQEFQYQATFLSPLNIPANQRFWLSLVDDTTGTPSTWGWETSIDGNGISSYKLHPPDPWQYSAIDMTFTLLTTNPPPSQNPWLFQALRFDAESGHSRESLGAYFIDHRAGRYIERRDMATLAAPSGGPLAGIDLPSVTFQDRGQSYTFLYDNPTTAFLQDPPATGKEPKYVFGGPGTVPIELVPLTLVSASPTIAPARPGPTTAGRSFPQCGCGPTQPRPPLTTPQDPPKLQDPPKGGTGGGGGGGGGGGLATPCDRIGGHAGGTTTGGGWLSSKQEAELEAATAASNNCRTGAGGDPPTNCAGFCRAAGRTCKFAGTNGTFTPIHTSRWVGNWSSYTYTCECDCLR